MDGETGPTRDRPITARDIEFHFSRDPRGFIRLCRDIVALNV